MRVLLHTDAQRIKNERIEPNECKRYTVTQPAALKTPSVDYTELLR